MRALDREQRDLDLAYGNTSPSTEVEMEAGMEKRMRDLGGTEMRKNRSNNSFQNIEREELEDEEDDQGREAGSAEKQKRPAAAGSAGRRATSGSWNPTTWFSGGAAATAGLGLGLGDDGGVGGQVAKEVKDAAQGMSSSVDR